MSDNQGYTIFTIDTETTGLNSEVHEVVEISACRLIPRLDGSFESEQKTWFLRATNPSSIEDEALAINGHKKEDILGLTVAGRNKYLLPSQVIPDFLNWIAEDGVSAIDRIFAGHNPNFDIDMLQSLLKRHGYHKEDFPFATNKGERILDTKMLVAFFDVCVGKRRKSYALGQVLKSCKVKKVGKAHTAAADTKNTESLLLKLVEISKDVIVKQFSECYNDDEIS